MSPNADAAQPIEELKHEEIRLAPRYRRIQSSLIHRLWPVAVASATTCVGNEDALGQPTAQEGHRGRL